MGEIDEETGEVVKEKPQCLICGKLSDGAKPVVADKHLCGTHYDDWLRSAERVDCTRGLPVCFSEFVTRWRRQLESPVWLTRDEAIERHNFDPSVRLGIPSKLVQGRDRRLVRVYLEAAVQAARS